MLVIREDQVKALEKVAVYNFVRQLAAHCKEFSPDLCKTLKEEQLHSAVEDGIDRAETHGFDQRGPVRFYVDMMIVLGSGFDTDPQYSWTAEILGKTEESEEAVEEEAEVTAEEVESDQAEEAAEATEEVVLDQMERAEALNTKVQEYLEKVDGENNVHTLKALAALSAYYKKGPKFSLESFERDTMRLMNEIHPRKVGETGKDALLQLITNSKTKSKELYNFQSARSLGLMAVLMFAFGHQCDTDPFLPWISKTLSKTGDIKPDTVADELERRAMIWLDAVLKNAKEEG